MSNYKPGTLDSNAVVRRWEQKRRLKINEANLPTGSQLYATTEKVQNFDTSELIKKVDSVTTKVGTLETSLDELSDHVDDSLLEYNSRISSAETKAEQALDDVVTVKSDVESLSARVDEQEQSIASINSNLSVLSGRVDSVSQNCTSLGLKVDSLSASLEGFESSIQETFDSINESIDAIKEQLESIGTGASFPVGSVLWISSETDPGDLGLDGTWELKSGTYLPLSDDTTAYYLYERRE